MAKASGTPQPKSSPASSFQLLDLPHDVLVIILQRLDLIELLKVAAVCRTLHGLVWNDFSHLVRRLSLPEVSQVDIQDRMAYSISRQWFY